MKTLENIVITDIRTKKKGYINPVAITFQNGEFSNVRSSNLNVSFSQNSIGNTVVECCTSYGHIFKDSKIHDKPESQLFVIKNKYSNKVRIIEVDNSFLINSALLLNSETQSNSSDYIQNLKALNQAFGGKKALSRLEQRDKLNINSMLVADEIKDSVSNISVENLSMSYSENDSIIKLLPPHNRNASIVSEVYSLYDILSPEELEIIKAEIPSEEELQPEHFSKYFLECLERAKNSKDVSDDKIAGVFFIELLIRFFTTPTKKLMNKKMVFCSFSDVIHSKIQNGFCVKNESSIQIRNILAITPRQKIGTSWVETENSFCLHPLKMLLAKYGAIRLGCPPTRTRPLEMKDKTLCHIIALSLICCDFQVNLKSLANDVSIHLIKLTKLARVVGAVPLSKNEHMFVLKLPLPSLPKISKGKKQR